MDFIKEYAWAFAVIGAPVTFWLISAIADPFHRVINKYMKNGEFKDALIDPEYEAKKAENPDKYKSL